MNFLPNKSMTKIFNPLNLNTETFGLDITDLSLRLAKIKKGGGGYKIENLARKEIPGGIIKRGEVRNANLLAQEIKSFVSEEKIKTPHAIMSLPEERSFVQVIRMPKISEEELKSSIQYEAEHYIPFPLEKVYLDAQIVPSLKKEKDFFEVLLVAMPKATIRPYIFAAKKADLIPMALEVESQSISRAVVKDDKSLIPLLIINIDRSRTVLILFAGTSIRFTASIPFSSALFNHKISQAMNISPDKAEEIKEKYGLEGKSKKGKELFDIMVPILTDLQEQIKKYIDYYHSHIVHDFLPQNGSSVKKVILSGIDADIKGLDKFFQEGLGLPVEIANPLNNFSSPQPKQFSNKKELLKFCSALGLAMRGINNPDYD